MYVTYMIWHLTHKCQIILFYFLLVEIAYPVDHCFSNLRNIGHGEFVKIQILDKVWNRPEILLPEILIQYNQPDISYKTSFSTAE